MRGGGPTPTRLQPAPRPWHPGEEEASRAVGAGPRERSGAQRRGPRRGGGAGRPKAQGAGGRLPGVCGGEARALLPSRLSRRPRPAFEVSVLGRNGGAGAGLGVGLGAPGRWRWLLRAVIVERGLLGPAFWVLSLPTGAR